MPSLKSQIDAAHQRHRLRVLGLRDERWGNDRHGLVEGSRRLLEREIAEIRQRAANDNLSRCAGRESDFDPTASIPSKEN